MKLGIGVPFRESISGEFFTSLINMIDSLGRDVEVKLISDSTYPLDMARCRIVEKARDGGCERLLFLDADVVADADQVRKMLGYDFDIISGIYNQKNKPYRPIIYERVTDHMFIDKILNNMDVAEVDGVGMGFCMIKMDVFNKMESPWFKNDWFEEWGKVGVLSEDLYFCKLARVAGYKVMVDPSLQAIHMGGSIGMLQYLAFAQINKEFIEDKKKLVKEVSEFLNVSTEEVWGKATAGTKLLADEYETFSDDDKFYKEAKNYIYDLMGWHMSGRREFNLTLRDNLLKQQKESKRKLKILDFGCGIGENAIMLAEAGLNVSVIDLNGFTYDFAKYRIKKRDLDIECYDVENPPDKKFDLIMCFDVLEHIKEEEFEAVINKIEKLKKPDGKVMITASFGKSKSHPMHYEITPEKEKLMDRLAGQTDGVRNP